MQINLKRALKLRKELEARVTKPELSLAVSHSLLIDSPVVSAQGTIEAGRAVLLQQVEDATLLSIILADLRTAIAAKNVENGIEERLAAIADIERRIALYKRIADAPLTPDMNIVAAEINLGVRAIHNPTQDHYSRAERAMGIAVVSAGMRAEAAQQLIELKREKESLEDERTATNARVRIEIPEDHAALLTKLGLI